MKKMKITVLIENHKSCEALTCEHGLSLWIEYNDKKILLDAGTTEAFAANARQLGICLNDAQFAVLSHGHYDHSGGFSAFFRENTHAVVYANAKAQEAYYSGNGGLHEIGVPAEILNNTQRFCFVNGIYRITEDIALIPHHTAGLDEIGKRAKLYKKHKNELAPDDFAHEHSLVFDTEKGLIIFNSCSHGGVEAIIKEVKDAYPTPKRVYAYIGGLHMKGTDNQTEICTFTAQQLDALCETVKKERIAFVYTGHCTGDVGYHELKQRIPDTIRTLYTGDEILL